MPDKLRDEHCVLDQKASMFGLFGSDPIKKLEKKYKQLLEESYRLSTTDRKASDLKRAEAEEVAEQIKTLKENSGHTS